MAETDAGAEAEPSEEDSGAETDDGSASESDAITDTTDAGTSTEDAAEASEPDATATETGSMDADVQDAASIDASVPDAAESVADAADTGSAEEGDADLCGASISHAEGCADGVRRGLTSATRHPDIAACVGSWTGDVSNGIALCSAGFHVCTATEPALHAVTYEEALCFTGCFAFDAVQDNYTCKPDCSSQVGRTDSAERLDMGGMGSSCLYKFVNESSCLLQGRIDATENDGVGCNYDPRLSGVVCCRD